MTANRTKTAPAANRRAGRKRAPLFGILVVGMVYGQPNGADVFAKTCGSGYCHGARGEGGGAPKLAGRGFDREYITSVTRSGVPGTRMQAYGTTLTRPDFAAVVGYVAKLNGIESPTGSEAAVRKLSGDAARGKALFSDPLRGFERCSTCHQADGIGIAVAPIGRVPGDLRNVTASHVRQVGLDHENFPGLVVSEGGRRVSAYDLSVVPPVFRSADAGAAKIGEATAWVHPVGPYGDAELKLIAVFLREALR